MMNVDDVLVHHAGEFGRFQHILLSALSLSEMFLTMTTFSPIFIAAVPQFRCVYSFLTDIYV